MTEYIHWIALALIVIGCFFVLGGLRHIFKQHASSLRGMMRCGLGLIPILIGIICALLAVALHGYTQLTDEQDVALLRFEQLAPQSFNATLTYPDGRSSQHILVGDDWRLEAQFIKWQSYATLLGAKPLYRLERLTGRYFDPQLEQNAPRSVISLDLTESTLPIRLPENLDLWRQARRQPWLGKMVDASYGSATYLPMRDNVTYQVSVTNSGLLAREIKP